MYFKTEGDFLQICKMKNKALIRKNHNLNISFANNIALLIMLVFFRYDERKLIIFLGIIPLIIFRLFMFPIGNQEIEMAPASNCTRGQRIFSLLLK